MKILLITPVWGHLGGVERYVADCAQEFIRQGHSCSVLYGRETAKPVENYISAGLDGAYQFRALATFDSVEDPAEVKRLDVILKIEQPDLIFMTGVRNFALLSLLRSYGRLVPMSHDYSLTCMRMSRTTYISKTTCTHNLGVRCLPHGCSLRKSHENDGRLIYNSLHKHRVLLNIYKEVGLHLVNSNYMKQVLVQHGFPSQNVRVVGLFTNLQPQKAASPNGQPPTISFIGRMNRYKGADYLIRALPHVSAPYRCTVIGEGEFTPYCRKLANKLGVSRLVDFLGWKSSEEINAHVVATSVVVVPSVFPEPFGIVGLEAMMCSKPIVAFDVGGISDWLKDGENGYLVPAENTKVLGQRIDALLKDPLSATAMGTAGNRFVTTAFTKKQHFDSLFLAFEQALARSSNGTSLNQLKVLI